MKRYRLSHQHVILRFLDRHPSLRTLPDVLDRNSLTLVFLISLVIILPFNLLSETGFYHDSFDYFELAETFNRHGFSFLNYHDDMRGYFFSFVLYLLQGLAEFLRIDPIFFFRLCFGLLVAAFISWLVPAYFEELTQLKVNFVSRLLFALLVIYFWQGYFLYPLTDFPALILIVVCLYTLLLSTKQTSINHLQRSVLVLTAGISVSLSSITRPSYLIVLLPIFFYFLFLLWRNFSNNSLRITLIILFVVGIFLGWLPQVAINLSNYYIPSPLVHAEVEGENLYETQLSWGIVMQRYETNIGSDLKTPRVIFEDQHGLNLRQDMNIDRSTVVISLRKYIRLLIRYPLDFAVLYFQHLFNGMDITYRTPYVEHLNNRRVIFSWLNYSLQFIALAATIIWLPSLRKQKRIITHVAILVLPSLLSLPGAVEMRFFLPVYLLIYSVVAYRIFPRFDLSWIKQRLYILLPVYLLYILVCFAMSSSAFMSIENLGYILNR